MQAEDRPIHFSTELFHPPVQHPVQALQHAYQSLAQTRAAAYESVDFSPPGPPRFYSKRGQKTQSILVILPDRLAVVEEWADIPLSSFLDKVDAVASHFMQPNGEGASMIGGIHAQTVTIRTTFALTHYSDARVFVFDRVCRQGGLITPHFQRPIAVGGLRFVLPETPEAPATLHVTIESFRHSANEVFVEVRGVFTGLHIAHAGSGPLRENIRQVRQLISDNVFPYLNQFDTPDEAFD